MQRFAQLFAQLDQTNKTNAKIEALASYFRDVDPASAAWGLYFLSGQKLQRLISSSMLRQWAIEAASIEQWLFDECYEAVGDLGETISLILPPPTSATQLVTLAEWVEEKLLPLRRRTVIQQRQEILGCWNVLDQIARLVFNKLLTGSLRVGVSEKMVVRGLSLATGIDPAVLAHRMMGSWNPSAQFYQQLLQSDVGDTEVSRPYPFFLANPLDEPPSALGQLDQWQAEWKWDGIRAQIIRRKGETFIWSRGEELMRGRFPELESTAELLPDGTVLDGEIVAYRNGQVQSFAQLQRRIGRKHVSQPILNNIPVAYLMFDILEWQGQDVRSLPLATRRGLLEELSRSLHAVGHRSQQPASTAGWLNLEVSAEGGSNAVPGTDLNFRLPDLVCAASWEALAELRAQSREARAEGLMLKRLSSPYRVGRPRGDWFKWKIQPYTIDAVLIYAQRGHGKRASLYTDYTFAVWDGDALVPLAKAYSGLTDKEIARVDRFVRQNTLERFGPVRSVTPALVFELAFENIQFSTRHKSGIAVRFPRILRWREDKSVHQADSLETIRAMLSGSPT